MWAWPSIPRSLNDLESKISRPYPIIIDWIARVFWCISVCNKWYYLSQYREFNVYSSQFYMCQNKDNTFEKNDDSCLELTAAVLLIRLAGYVHRVFDWESALLWLWTDSCVALTWIITYPLKWKDFVRNRVSFQKNQPITWCHLLLENRIQLIVRRAATPKSLTKHQLWWSGPEWLSLPLNQWPDGVCPPTPR